MQYKRHYVENNYDKSYKTPKIFFEKGLHNKVFIVLCIITVALLLLLNWLLKKRGVTDENWLFEIIEKR